MLLQTHGMHWAVGPSGSGPDRDGHDVKHAHACMHYNTPYCMDAQRQVRASMPAAQRLLALYMEALASVDSFHGGGGPFLKVGSGA